MRFFILCLFSMTSVWVHAQAKFIARANASQLFEGDLVTVEFTIENVRNPQEFQPPNFKNCDLISGPNKSMRSTYVNGKSSSSITYTYSLLPKQLGKYTFTPATVLIGGKKFESNRIQFEVLGNDKRKKGGDQADRFFVRAEIDSSAFYIGQQINLVYTLYTLEDVQSINILSESSFDGFYAEEVQNFKSSVRKEIINGSNYFTKDIRRIALFPQQSGKLTIEPATFRLGIGKSDPFFGGLFNRPSGKYINSRTAEITLQIQDPYSKCAQDFAGAVGQFEHRFAFNRAALSTDDAMRIQLEIKGNGDVKTIQAPTLTLPDAFEFYGSEVLQEQLINSNTGKRSVKTFQYTYLPTKAGNYTFKLAFTYLDPQYDSCITKVDSFDYFIKQGVNTNNESTLISPDTTTGSPLVYAYSNKVKSRAVLWSRSPIFWSLAILPWLFVGYKRVKPLVNKQKDQEISALDNFKTYLASLDDADTGFTTESFMLAFKSFIVEQYNCSSEQISAAHIEDLLNDSVSDPLLELYKRILFQGELALYARNDNSSELQAAINALRQALHKG